MGQGYRFKAKGSKSAEIQIYEDVGAGWFGGVTAQQIADDIKAAGAVEQLDVRIASYGGDVSDGMAIYRMLVEHKARVTTHVDGVAASIASVIAMAGDEIVIAESGSMMIHEGWTIAAGHADDMRAAADHLDRSSVQIAGIYADRTKQPLQQVKDWMKATTWFYGQEAVDKGFASSVAQNMKAAASASMWNSMMAGRVATHMHTQRIDAGAAHPHPSNDDVRAQLAAVTERQRQKALARSRGARA